LPIANTSEAATKNSISALQRSVENAMDDYSNPSMSINWRASLVPAAAVIPAPIAYANAVAVKKLVVGFKVCGCT
jgi:hypothetical protein